MKFFPRQSAARITGKLAGERRSDRFAWLSTDKAPLYVSFFFAALAWTLVRTVDRVAATPIVEYSVDPHSQTFVADGHGRVIGVRFRNMTFARPVNCLNVILKTRPTTSGGAPSLAFTKFTPSTYRVNGHVYARATVIPALTDTAEMHLENFPPGADIEFGLGAAGEGDLIVKARPCDALKLAEGAPTMPVILERSLKTRLIERELEVLWSGLALWALALMGLAIARGGRASMGDK